MSGWEATRKCSQYAHAYAEPFASRSVGVITVWACVVFVVVRCVDVGSVELSKAPVVPRNQMLSPCRGASYRDEEIVWV